MFTSPPLPGSRVRTITIIGGGASGVLLAVHLLRAGGADIHVNLIERRGEFGQGVAYSARQRDHLVNVPARGMSAFSDDPEHFWRWLQLGGHTTSSTSWVFMPRRLYGAYLNDLLTEAGRSRPHRLTVYTQEVMCVRETAHGAEVFLANGATLSSHEVVLAVGHETQPARGRGLAVRAGSPADTPLDPEAPVMILGSGLSMVDAWLSLNAGNHRGPIYVVSRNGLLPQGHREVPPLAIDAGDVPFGAPLGQFSRWFRGVVAKHTATGGDWRSVVDGLRPHNQRIWKSWSPRSRRQFLAHLRPFWNIHRHRLPPELHARMEAAVRQGQVRLVAGHFLNVSRTSTGVSATIRRRGSATSDCIEVARLYDCGGVSVDVEASSNPVIQDLVKTGRARPDPLHIGLDVTDDCMVIDATGKPSTHLFVVGPLTRGRFFEIEAIPDIRLQCARLAGQLCAGEALPARQRRSPLRAR